MSEAHVHGFANRLQRTIIVIDAREEALVITEYIPGYAVAQQISMREARKRRESKQQQPLWLLMSPSHWLECAPAGRRRERGRVRYTQHDPPALGLSAF